VLGAAKKDRVTPIGVDLSDRTVRAIQFRSSAHGLTVQASGAKTFCAIDSSAIDRDTVVSSIRDVLNSDDFIGNKAVAAVPGDDLDIRPVTIPDPGPDDEDNIFEKALMVEARSCLVYDPADAMINYLTVSSTEKGEGRVSHVLLMATHKNTVGARVGLLEDAGLDCVHLDAGPCAAIRSMGTESGRHCVIELDDTRCVISMGDGAKLLFSRTVPLGTGQFVNTVSDKLDIGKGEAQSILRCVGIKHENRPQSSYKDFEEMGRIPSEHLPYGITEICVDVLNSLVTEIKRTFNYFSGLPSGGRIEKVHLVGTVFPRYLDRFLARELGVPVNLGDLTSQVPEKPWGGSRNDGVYAVATGLAMRGDE
jgi:type IV pilus assembly protein PilM